MKIKRLHIKNYKSIKELEIDDAQDALILVGRNNSGKSVILMQSVLLLAIKQLICRILMARREIL